MKPGEPVSPSDRGPLRVLFVLTSMPVGGAEILLRELVNRLDRNRFSPEIACLKELGVLGKEMASSVPIAYEFLAHKYDIRVLPKLTNHLTRRRIDAIVTVGAGDKMFWGRLAGYCAQTPVVLSALHSTGWPDGVGRLNRALTPITDGFIAVADEHGRYLREVENFPASKVHVIPNGVDTDRFRKDITARCSAREELRIPMDAPVCGIVAALRPEKNHDMFLHGAVRIRSQFPDARFLIVGDGPERDRLEALARSLNLADAVHFLGARDDVPSLLAAMSVLVLTSKMEANPVSILEALSAEVPVVATRVGSVPTSVVDGETGFLVSPNDSNDFADKVCLVLSDPDGADRMGKTGRSMVEANCSVDVMVKGYEQLIEHLYHSKVDTQGNSSESIRTPVVGAELEKPAETAECTSA